MKAITLHQPWATFIALGIKHYETRSWATPHRGPIAIHAGKVTNAQIDEAIDIYGDILEEYRLSAANLPSGAVVATAQLVKCHYMNEALVRTTRRADGYEARVGDWSIGRFAWQLDDVVAVDPPIPARGMQGLWDFNGALPGMDEPPTTTDSITQSQRDLIRILARKHGIDVMTMDRYVDAEFECPVAELSKREASALLDRMLTWMVAPPEIARLRGQMDLFAIGDAS